MPARVAMQARTVPVRPRPPIQTTSIRSPRLARSKTLQGRLRFTGRLRGDGAGDGGGAAADHRQADTSSCCRRGRPSQRVGIPFQGNQSVIRATVTGTFPRPAALRTPQCLHALPAGARSLSLRAMRLALCALPSAYRQVPTYPRHTVRYQFHYGFIISSSFRFST
jgi:hypothetical protein